MTRRLGVLLCLSLLALPAFSAITGTVMTGEGAPIAGARVSIHAHEPRAAQRLRLLSENPEAVPLAFVQTDAKGAFSLESPKQPVVTLRVTANGYAPTSRRVERDEEAGALVLQANAARTGSVVSGNNKPVAGATVILTYGTTEVVAKTDEQGRYPAGDPKRIRRITVVHPGYAIDDKRVEWRQTLAERDFHRTLSNGIKVSGRVVGPDGKTPVAGAEVSLDGWPLAESGEDGTFTIAHAPSRWTSLTARKEALVAGVTFSKEATQTLRLMKAATIAGRVLDAGSRVPVAGALVSATQMRSGGAEGLLVAETDAKGAYSIPVPAGSYTVVTDHPAYEAGDGESTAAAGQQAVRDFTLTQLARVSGVVMNEERLPVAAAVVTDQPAGDPFRRGFRMRFTPGSTVVSGPDGRFSRRVPADQPLTLRAAKRGFPNATSEQLRLTAGERKGGVVLTIPSGIAVSGKVTGPDGTALSGVAVTANEAEPGRGGMFMRTIIMADSDGDEDVVRTASDGTFSMRLKEGTYDFSFRREGYAPKLVRAQGINPSATTVDTTLDPASEITGRVVRGGKGVENAILNVFSPGMEASATTGPDGSFTLSGLAAGPVMVMLRKEDEFIAERRSLTAPSRDVVVQLPGGGRITGRVVDKATNKPLTQFQAGISMSRGGGGMISMAPPQLRDFTSDDGSFTLENVPPGAMTVVANAPGYASGNLNVTVEEGKTLSDVELQLDAGIRLTGRVTGPNGSPLSDVSVRLEPSTGGAFAMRGMEMSATTDANGEYTLEALQAGEESVTFSHPKYLSASKDVTLKGRETRLDVQLAAGQRVTGTVVTESGAPVAEAYVQAGGSGWSGESARTNANGVFEMEGMTPGRYRFSARKSGVGEGVLEDVEIGSGAPVRIVMRSGAVITGRVTGLSPQEYANTTVDARAGRNSASASVDASGAFRMEGAPSGTVQISATVASRDFTTRRSSGWQTIEVPEGGSQSVDIAFSNDITIRGRVTRNSAPLPNANVLFVPRPGSRAQANASATTDESGVYSVTGVQEGEYNVYVMDMQRYSPYHTTHLVRGSDTFDIDYRTGTLSGRVVDAANGAPLSGATVQLRLKNPTEVFRMLQRGATTDTAGTFIIDAVPAGAYVISASGDGLGTVTEDLSVTEAGRDGLELKLTRTAGVTLRVIDARSGQPISAMVNVFDLQGQLVYGAPIMWGGGEKTEIKLPLAAGTFSASVDANLYAPLNVRIQSPGTEVVRLTPGGTLNIRSRHTERLRVRLIDANGIPYLRESNPLPWRNLLAGTTTIAHVAPGTYTLLLLGANDVVLDSKQVTVEEGVTTETEI
ncbi:MAG TPA: carboxypeptidase regulatory-like domain-containing protein [Thermoanaerobaculia bacterium]